MTYSNGDCDFALVPLTPDYVADLLWYMAEVERFHRADDSVYNLECWDATPSYFRFNEKLEAIRDVYGDLAVDVPRGEPILLTADPMFGEEEFQRVECQTVQAAEDEVWWTAYVNHTNVRIETARIPKKVLLMVQDRFAKDERHAGKRRCVPPHPAIRSIHDFLYLDMRGARTFYNPDIMRTSGLCAVHCGNCHLVVVLVIS
jgi:hypothetical protein